jgi:hypothetical protein
MPHFARHAMQNFRDALALLSFGGAGPARGLAAMATPKTEKTTTKTTKV